MSKKKRSRIAANKHYWKYKLRNGRIVSKAAKVIYATTPVTLELTADHVGESIRVKGVGDTQTCSMAICTVKQASRFPHPVTGDVEWYYSRAFVGSKLDSDGFVSECYVYVHNDDVAKYQDSKDGQKKLFAELRQNGDRKVRLLPLTESERGTHRSGGEHRGSREDGTRRARYKGTQARVAHVLASA